MGRHKEYRREDLLDRATELFRDHGYAATSTQMLVDHLGVNRNTMYAEFGNKQGLFDAVLERYDQRNVANNFGPLEQPGAGLAEIRALLRFFSDAASGPAYGRGCLLCNTAVELGPLDPGGKRLVRRYFERIQAAFDNALSNARRAGALRPRVAVADEARFFASVTYGMFVLLRAQAPPESVRSSAAVARRHLASLSA